MTKIRTVIVRQPRSGAVLEWRPSSERASLRELVQMLEEDPDSPEVAPIDLIEPNTARLLDLESEVGDLQGEVLVARGGFLRNALDQMEALREQSPSLISFTQVAGSPVIGAELRVPALQATPGRPGVRIRGRHQLLVVLPSTFPEAPPRLVWLTPIFHPNIAMDHDAWPRGYEWNKSSSLLQLVSALIDSVAGLNVSVRGRFSLSRHKALNDQATSWFRKNGQQIANYGRLSLHSDMWRPEQQPLTSSNESWILEGVTHGGDPVVFLSGRFHRGLERFAKYGPGWLLGTRGHQGKHPWYYIDRAVPWRPESSAPPDTIGLLRHIGADPEPVWSSSETPIIATYENDGISLRTGIDGTGLAGYFLENDIALSGVTPPFIRVGPATEPEPSVILSVDIDPEPALTPVSLVAAVCPFCSGPCGTDRAWGACPECTTDTHVDCYEEIGGCPETSCSLSPLYLGD